MSCFFNCCFWNYKKGHNGDNLEVNNKVTHSNKLTESIAVTVALLLGI